MSHTTSRRMIAGGSVPRRPAASLVRDPSGPSSSAAQRAGLTTPTRRGRNGQRESRALGHEAGDEERSPSQRSAAAKRTKLQTPQGQCRCRSAVVLRLIPAAVPFPNLRNSFAQPGRVARNGVLNSAAKGKAAVRDGDGSPDVEMADAAPDVNGDRQPVTAELQSLPWHDVRARYPLMQAIYARRRAALMGHVLAHSSCATSSAHRQAGPAPRTVQKLLVAALPAWLPSDTHALYASATANLLGILSSVGDGPQRFAFLAHNAAHVPSGSETDDAADFWDAHKLCEDGLAGLLDSIAAVLRAMLQCLMLARHVSRLAFCRCCWLTHAGAVRGNTRRAVSGHESRILTPHFRLLSPRARSTSSHRRNASTTHTWLVIGTALRICARRTRAAACRARNKNRHHAGRGKE
jgi:hypothetical protein